MDKKTTILYSLVTLGIFMAIGFSFFNYIVLRHYNTVIEQDPDAYNKYFNIPSTSEAVK